MKSAAVVNPFTDSIEARRYDNYRPEYHHLFVEELKNYLINKNIKFEHVLDVACGTGHSTKALKKIFSKIKACDASESMLQIAKKIENVDFIISKSEKTPFLNSEFDLVNVSMAYQWFDQNKFLNECHRILKPSGLLCIDNYGFTGLAQDVPEFKDFYRSVDLSLMPAAPRNLNYPDDEQLSNNSMRFVDQLNYEHNVLMTKSQFVNYLMTRSNFQVLSNDKKSEIEQKLLQLYEPVFEKSLTLKFKGASRLYRFG